MKTPLEIYVHIPFCERKCAYCDFLSAPAEASVRNRYVEALLCEIQLVPEREENYEVVSIFFGGGTPSLLTGEQMKRILKTLRTCFAVAEDAEISMEANPGTVDREKLAAYRQAGVNRLSLGLQSTEDEELALLGRIHNYETFLETYRMAREAGFMNINVDLMSSLPGQSVESWERSLRRIVALEPEHISAYSLIVEEGTPFYEKYGEDDRRREEGEDPIWLPTEEEERLMYQRTGEILREAGYERYEISNYSKPGLACRHNEGYWIGVPYLGLGLGASSYIKETRFSNCCELSDYLDAKGDVSQLREDICHLTDKERQEEFFFLGLRRMEGVSRERYQERFGEDWAPYQEKIYVLLKQGLLEETEAGIRLSKKGIDVSNGVFAELLS
ncbi:MAG: radical SAM family heme chaperone HemW [Lachnospiraceae bacterium]|nr:radical SAM family heme chaperone HemW [Lachnospiraceae bacterium]